MKIFCSIKSTFLWGCKYFPVHHKLRWYHNHNGPWDILFFGTDEFALKSLDYLHNLKLHNRLVNKLEVVCPVDKRRPKDIKKHPGVSTVRQLAEVNRLSVHDWPLEPQNSSFISTFHLGVVISFGHFIPSWIIKSLPCGAINLHPSLLPRWRGPSPMVHTLLSGDTETGVSVIDVSTKKFDAGAVLLQEEIQVQADKTYGELSGELSELSSYLVGKVLTDFTHYKNSAVPQDEQFVTTAPKVTKELGYVKWSQYSCSYIRRLWCAIGQQIGLRCKWEKNIVKFGFLVEIKNFFPDAPETANPGQPFFDSSRNILYIRCKDGWVGWSSLQIEYRQVIKAKEFYNGYLIDKNTGKITSSVFEDIN